MYEKFQVMSDLTKEERERLKADIKENGLEMPIDVDENGNILDGHERKSICDELGIPCERTVHPGITEEEKPSVAGAIKEQKRERLSSKPDADVNKGIDVIITPADDIPGVTGCRIIRADAEENLDSQAEMYNVDCLEYMRTLPDESVDLIVADPPYFQVYGDFDFIWDSEDDYLKWIYSCMTEFYRILKPTGTLVLWGTLKTYHDVLAEIIVWNKRNELFKKKGLITIRNTRGTGVQDNFMSVSEQYLFYTKSDQYAFNVPYLDEPTGRKDKGANGKERPHEYKRVSDVWIDFAEASQSSIERCFHPTTKALKACDRIIQTHSDEGNLVYIPYTGSGSEIVSCIKNNRHFIGTEINKEYFEKSIEHIIKLLKKKC